MGYGIGRFAPEPGKRAGSFRADRPAQSARRGAAQEKLCPQRSASQRDSIPRLFDRGHTNGSSFEKIMTQRSQTPDERLMLRLYETAMENGDPFYAIDWRVIAPKIGQ